MSNLVIQTNVLALNSHRNAKIVGTMQSKASARLSSGYKINSAADDAAGLAISEKMRSQIRGLDMASKNAQDGISLIQTAEGGMQEIDNMLQRIRELVVQVSNDTNENNTIGTGDRQKIQDEINALTEEIDSMAERVEFNKKKVINGSYSDPSQLLAAASTRYSATMSDLALATSIRDSALTSAQKAGDDYSEIRTLVDGYDAGLATKQGALAAAENALAAIKAADYSLADDGLDNGVAGAVLGQFIKEVQSLDASALNETALNSLVAKYFATDATGSNAAGDLLLSTAAIGTTSKIGGQVTHGAGAAIGGTAAADVAGIGWVTGGSEVVDDLIAALSDVYAKVGNIVGAKAAVDAHSGVTTGTVNGVTKDGYFQSALTYTATHSQNVDVNANNAAELYESLNAYTKTKMDSDTALGDATRKVDFLNDMADRYSKQVTAASLQAATLGVNAPGLYFQVGANANQGLQTSIGSVKTDVLGIGNGYGKSTIDVVKHTGKDITAYLDLMDEALSYVTTERSKLGATQNRMEYTIKSLDISSENISAAESRIRDTDMAKEMMNLTKANVLQQAATAMLAQANQAPQSVLQLLR